MLHVSYQIWITAIFDLVVHYEERPGFFRSAPPAPAPGYEGTAARQRTCASTPLAVNVGLQSPEGRQSRGRAPRRAGRTPGPGQLESCPVSEGKPPLAATQSLSHIKAT